MLRITAKKGGKSAEYYLKDDLGQPAIGEWMGKLSHIMGLHGEVDHDTFRELANNRIHGEKLRQRDRGEDGLALYDYTFLMSKSAAVVGELLGDERIFEAGRKALNQVAEMMEADMQTRARRFGLMADRDTGNMLAASWEHRMGRPTKEDGMGDVLRHYHLTVLNATLDMTEGKIKASKQHRMMKSNEYYASAFHSFHAAELEKIGYRTARKGKYFSLEGVPESLVKKFSRREEEANAYREEHGLEGKAAIQCGAASRSKKNHSITMEELSEHWKSRVSAREWKALEAVRDKAESRVVETKPELSLEPMALDAKAQEIEPSDPRYLREAVKQAWQVQIAKRKPETPERKLAAAAMQRTYGKAEPREVLKAIEASGFKRTDSKGYTMLTRKVARTGRGMAERIRRSIHDRIRMSRAWVRSEMVQERGWTR